MSIAQEMQSITLSRLRSSAESLNAAVGAGWMEQTESLRVLRGLAESDSPILMIGETAEAMVDDALKHFGSRGEHMQDAFAATAIRMFLWGLYYGREGQ